MRTPINNLALGLSILAQHDPTAQPHITDVPVDKNGTPTTPDKADKTLRAITVTVKHFPPSRHNFLVQHLSFDHTTIDDGTTIRYEFYPALLQTT